MRTKGTTQRKCDACPKCGLPKQKRSAVCDKCRRDEVMDEPTEEQLEKMIEEQMRCLPDWWHQDSRRKLP